MTIILMDGSFITASKVEISCDRAYLILDECIHIDIDEVVRIV